MRSSRFQLQSFARRWSTGRPSVTSVLIASAVAFTCAQWIAAGISGDILFSQESLSALMGIAASTVEAGRFWQFVTFALIHAGPVHLVANLLLLYFAGREVEPILGSRHFLGLYAIATVVGGVAQWAALAGGLAPSGAIFVGMSAGAAAVVAAFATILPELEVTMLLFFVLPLRVRAKLFGMAVIATAALLWLAQTATEIGPVAILAGSFVGWAYVKQLGFGNPLAIERYFLERRQHASRLARMPADQFIAEELDPVLEKVARTGMASLTRAEKKLLQQGSEKLAGAKR